ncbi:hypothetical protein SAMN05660297_02784 [Natronincola peptidivorans]|uniref:Uncharacterized protein n=1 Tax=Natronincola peptidivorans TaxID=426128 RepID=A0A1I0FEM0_9FIRM|nr:hypothetical protein [Natronincola peptidivorans]SET56458.1 hypothetical protein SAMN05660297_02784 [Natronincola peptidivorans]
MRSSKKHLVQLLNTNFDEKDKEIVVTFNYENEKRDDEIKAQNDVANYLDRVKEYRNKAKNRQ